MWILIESAVLADSSFAGWFPASFGSDLLLTFVAAVVSLVVFSFMYASKIEAGRRHVEELKRALQDREKAVLAQQASESRYRAIVNEQSDLIVRWKADGTLLFANQAWCDFQGCTQEEAIGTDFLSIVPDQRREALRSWSARVTVEQPVVSGESKFVTVDGRQHFQLWTEHGIFDDSGNLIEIQSVGRDVTAEREAEEQFKEQQSLLAHVSRLSTMGELVAGIAHEVNQPLYSIKNCSQALQNVLADDCPENKELMVQCADQISDASSRAGEMIRRMRNFVRHGETEREVCDLNVLVTEAARLVGFEGQRNNASVNVMNSEQVVSVCVDRVQIQQVLVNLIKNAFESMAAAECETREVKVSCKIIGTTGRVSISDSGAGVSKEISKSIFDAFVTTRREGMGMGLAISRTIVEGHDGGIWLDQGTDSGATFHVEIPLIDDSADSEKSGLSCNSSDVPEATTNVVVQEV